jgi:hypothetical protein
MPVRMIFDSGQQYRGRAYRDRIASAHAHGVAMVLAQRGMRWDFRNGVFARHPCAVAAASRRHR